MGTGTRLIRNKPSVSHALGSASGLPDARSRGPLARTARPALPSPASALGSGGSTMKADERSPGRTARTVNGQRLCWVNGRPVEHDCPRGCCLSAEQVQAFDARHGRRPVDWLTRFVSAWRGVRLEAALLASRGRGYPGASH